MRHERFAIVLADVAIRDIARLTSEVARELSAVVVFHDDGVLRKLEDVQNSFPVQRNEPPDLELIGGDTAFGNFVAFVTIRFLRWISGDDHLASIDLGIEVELFGIHRRPAFREQQVAENDSRTLETVGEVVHFGNEFETIRNVRWRGNESWKVAESRAQHLP